MSDSEFSFQALQVQSGSKWLSHSSAVVPPGSGPPQVGGRAHQEVTVPAAGTRYDVTSCVSVHDDRTTRTPAPHWLSAPHQPRECRDNFQFQFLVYKNVDQSSHKCIYDYKFKFYSCRQRSGFCNSQVAFIIFRSLLAQYQKVWKLNSL